MTKESFRTKKEFFTEGRKRLAASLAVMAFLQEAWLAAVKKLADRGHKIHPSKSQRLQ